MATNRQSDKTGTVKVTSPTTKLPITTILQVTEDASAYPVVDGVSQSGGVAYCDGSTLVNTSGKYDDFEAAHGSLVLPNGPFRTVERNLAVSNTPAGWTAAAYDIRGYAYSDIAGNWRLNFRITASMTAAGGGSVDIDGVTFYNTGNGVQAIAAENQGTGVYTHALVGDNNNTVSVTHSASNTAFWVNGDVALDAKPTWADANLESFPTIALFNNPGANVLGIPKNDWAKKHQTADSTTNGTMADMTFGSLVVGNAYRYTFQLSYSVNVTDNVFTADIKNGTTVLNIARAHDDDSGGAIATVSYSEIFIATDAAMTIVTSGMSADAFIRGESGGKESWLMIEELTDYALAATNKWD